MKLSYTTETELRVFTVLRADKSELLTTKEASC